MFKLFKKKNDKIEEKISSRMTAKEACIKSNISKNKNDDITIKEYKVYLDSEINKMYEIIEEKCTCGKKMCDYYVLNIDAFTDDRSYGDKKELIKKGEEMKINRFKEEFESRGYDVKFGTSNIYLNWSEDRIKECEENI